MTSFASKLFPENPSCFDSFDFRFPYILMIIELNIPMLTYHSWFSHISTYLSLRTKLVRQLFSRILSVILMRYLSADWTRDVLISDCTPNLAYFLTSPTIFKPAISFVFGRVSVFSPVSYLRIAALSRVMRLLALLGIEFASINLLILLHVQELLFARLLHWKKNGFLIPHLRP